MKNLLSFLIICCLIVAGCSESTNPDTNETIIKSALVHWSGAYEVDGCGFFIEIDSKMYKPINEENITEKYKTNNPSSVYLKFKYLDEQVPSSCGDAPFPVMNDGIEIIEMSDFVHNKLLGEWEWVESSGGIAGVTLIPETEGYTKTYHFSSDSNLSIYKNDTLISETTYQVVGDTLKINGQDINQIIEYKTDRIILYDLCVDCFISTFERKGIEPELIRTVGNWYTLNLQSDPVDIRTVAISDDVINLEIGYSGCVGHEFELFSSSYFMESNPVQIPIGLYHKSSYDMCPQYSIRTISFSLVPLKELYQHYYSDNGQIILRISAVGDSVIYNPKPTYEF